MKIEPFFRIPGEGFFVGGGHPWAPSLASTTRLSFPQNNLGEGQPRGIYLPRKPVRLRREDERQPARKLARMLDFSPSPVIGRGGRGVRAPRVGAADTVSRR